MEEVFYEKEEYKLKDNILLVAAIFLIIRYLMYIGFQICQTIEFGWSHRELGVVMMFILLIGIPIVNFGYLLLLVLGISSNIKKIKEATQLEKTILALLFTAITILIITGIMYAITMDPNVDDQIFDSNNVIGLNDGAMIVRTFMDIVATMIILILTGKMLRKRIGQTHYGRRLITPWILIPVLVTLIGLFIRMLTIMVKYPILDFTFFYDINDPYLPFPIFYLVFYIAVIIYGVVGVILGIEFLIKMIKIKKGTTSKPVKKIEEENGLIEISNQENEMPIEENFEKGKIIQEVFNGKEQFYTKNNMLRFTGILLIIRYCLFFGLQINFVYIEYSHQLSILQIIINIILFIGVVFTYIVTLLLVLHETIYNKKIKNYSKLEKVNFAFIVTSIVILFIFIICFLIFWNNPNRDEIRWPLMLWEGSILIRFFLEIITLTIIMVLTNILLKKRYGSEIFGKQMVTPWLFIPTTITLIGLLPKMILILIEHPSTRIFSFYFWNDVINPSPIFYLICLITICLYGIVGIGMGIEFIIKNKKINNMIDYKSTKLFEDELEN